MFNVKDNIINLDNKKQTKEKKNLISKQYLLFKSAALSMIENNNISDRNKQLSVIRQLEILTGYKLLAAELKDLHQAINQINFKNNDFVVIRYVKDKLNSIPTIFYTGTIYRYNTDKGNYIKVDDKDLKKEFLSDGDVPEKKQNSRNATEYVNLLHTLADSDIEEISKKYINCKNCVYDIETDTMLEHSPELKTVVQINANIKAISQEEFNKSIFKTKFLNAIFEPDTQNLIQEMFALLISPHAKEVNKMFVLYGDGSNGKSALADIAESLLGAENNANIDLNDFNKLENRFALTSLLGKHYNINTDAEKCNGLGSEFKRAIGGETIDIEEKGKNKLKLKINMTYVFALNNLPKNNGDRSHGFYRRSCIIPMNKIFGTEKEVQEGKADIVADEAIIKTIIDKELDIVLFWAIEGLQRLITNNYNLSESKAAAESLEDFKRETNTAYDFFETHIVRVADKKKKMFVTDAYNKYCEFLRDTCREDIRMSITSFGKELKKHIPKNAECKKCRANTGYYYSHCELIELEDMEKEF